jgi:hypothetical protein
MSERDWSDGKPTHRVPPVPSCALVDVPEHHWVAVPPHGEVRCVCGSAGCTKPQGEGTLEQVTAADDAWIAAIEAARSALAKEPR